MPPGRIYNSNHPTLIALLMTIGCDVIDLGTVADTLVAGFERQRVGDRQEFLRARIENGQAVLYPNKSSGALTSMSWAKGLVEIEAGRTLAPSDAVRFIPVAELLGA